MSSLFNESHYSLVIFIMKYPSKYRMDKAEKYAVIILFISSLICFIIPEFLQRATAKTTIVYREIKPFGQSAIQSHKVMKSEGLLAVNYSDPNTISKDSLIHYGLDAVTAQRLVNFRNKGKVYSSDEDVLEVFGMTKQKIESIEVQFFFKPIVKKPIRRVKQKTVDVNNATQQELEDLSGIGPVFAKRIIKYRTLLGGYNNKSQLLEVYGFDQDLFNKIESSIQINLSAIKKIELNSCDFITLLRHPYISKNVCKAIINYREQHGNFATAKDLLEIKIIDSELTEIMKPYFKFSGKDKEIPNPIVQSGKVGEIF